MENGWLTKFPFSNTRQSDRVFYGNFLGEYTVFCPLTMYYKVGKLAIREGEVEYEEMVVCIFSDVDAHLGWL
jgi:hypothetical protein